MRPHQIGAKDGGRRRTMTAGLPRALGGAMHGILGAAAPISKATNRELQSGPMMTTQRLQHGHKMLH
eukprot:8038209-Heterocapsa_arctica.AAC.1